MGGEGGGWEGGVVAGECCPGRLRRPSRGGAGRPPTCPFHPTFLSRPAPASDLAVIEVGEQCTLFFVGSVHQQQVCKGDYIYIYIYIYIYRSRYLSIYLSIYLHMCPTGTT